MNLGASRNDKDSEGSGLSLDRLKSVWPRKDFNTAPSPEYCELIVTEKCNFQCRMCLLWKKESLPENQKPQLEDWKSFVSSLRQKIDLPFTISICGGETLLYPDLEELAGYCSSLGFCVSITTNAYFLDDKKLSSLYAAGVRDFVISLDSLDESVHDSIRGKKGSHRNAMKAIELFSRYKDAKLTVLAVIMSLNIDSIIPLVHMLNENKNVSAISFNSVTEPIGSEQNGALEAEWYYAGEMSFLWPGKAKSNQLIDELLQLKGKGYRIGNSEEQLNIFRRYYNEPEKFAIRGSCPMATGISIDCTGSIYMCHAFGQIGNIKNRDFGRAWDSKKSAETRGKIYTCRKNCKMLVNCNIKE